MGRSSLLGAGTPASVPVLQRISVGVLCGLVTTVFSLSYAALLFSGGLGGDVAAGMGVMLVSSAILALVTAALTSFPPTYSQVRDIPIAYLALIAPAVAGAVTAPDETLPTIIVLVGITSFAIGVSFLVIGQLRLGRMVRFVPFPVVSGFLAGVAWLIVTGALAILTGEPFHLASVPELFGADTLPKMAVTAAFVLASVVGRRWLGPGILIPLLVIVATIAFQFVVAASAQSGSYFIDAGWLARVPENTTLWPSIGFGDLAHVDWGAIGAQWYTIAVIVPVALIALLLNISGLEADAKRDIDLDAELKTAGAANILAGLVGGAPGYQSLSMTLISQRLGGGTRLTSFVAGLFLLVALTLGSDIVGLVPLPVLAGIVLATGGSLLWERLVGSFGRLALGEYLILLAIFVVTVWLGFLSAVVFGIVAAMALFVIDYSRSGVVKLDLTGSDYQSSTESSDARRKALQAHGHVILILRLQGFLFFGTANGLRRTIERRFEASADRAAVRHVVLDCRRISGIDSAAVEAFSRLSQTATDRGIRLVLTNVGEGVVRTLVRGGLPLNGSAGITVADSFDRALHDIEDEVLADVDPALAVRAPRPIGEQLRLFVEDAEHLDQLIAYLERVTFAAGDLVVEEGTPADDMFFIETGTAAVRIAAGGHHVTLTTLGPGSIVGEIAFYLGARSTRTASVVAEGEVVAWRFTKTSLGRMEALSPGIASRFHHGMAEILADRLAATNRLVRFLAT